MPIAFAIGMRPDPSPVWTCPFCPLLCDDRPASATGCALAEAGLQACRWPVSAACPPPRIDGQPATLEAALAAAAQRLACSRQPLIGGWGTDVAGVRALTTLAEATGAFCDAAAGEALSQTLRVQQDRGGYTTTLAEVREHADLIVVLGSGVLSRAPRLLERVLDGRTTPPQIVHLDAPGDLPDTLVRLHLLVAGKTPAAAEAQASPALATLAAQLKAARYAVLVWEPSKLGAHAALCIERLMQLIQRLNQTTRAAGLPIGGADGAMTAQYVHAWRTGLPLRSRHGPRGLEHDPLRFGAPRLLADGAVDLLLWVASFPGQVAGGVPAAAGLPRIVFGLPALAAQLGDERHTVFIPVATPGVHADGHLFRVDGVVLMPLHALQDDGLPGVAAVVDTLTQALAPGRAAA